MSDCEVLEDFQAEKNSTKKIESLHVKFQLQKECHFGEHFLLIGDHPIIGSWNLSKAIPMNWSDGHLWSVELVRNWNKFRA
ncbi:Carbohydrate binding module family 20 [Dillenia turbinata]|uniref:Carbohydrate binding module family 20 n=1 Tax=Dillenia turbinata TaxID=194707 RepID=A0AAN8ZU84_9MAGN